jgi:DNA-binding transcriptional MerR regulator
MAKSSPLPVTKLHTENQEAERLGLSVRTLQAWRQNGGGPPFFKIGAAVRYNPTQVDDWLSAHARTNTAGGRAA